MSVSEDIKRILWHEMGHLCVDLIKIESHNYLSINQVALGHQNYVGDQFNWNGYVEMQPAIPFEDIPNDFSVLAYSLISLQAGCIFEMIFFKKILKDSSTNFEDCFSIKKDALGNGDRRSYSEILSAILKTNPEFRGKKDVLKFIEKEFVHKVKDRFFGLDDFIKKLDVLVNKEVIKIEGNYNENKDRGDYSYNYTDDELIGLSKNVKVVIDEFQFRENLKEIHDYFVASYSKYLDKYKTSIEI